MNQILTIFAREPIAGRTKTRLCPPLDAATAAALYACFLRDVLDLAACVPETRTVIAYTPETDSAFFGEFAPTIEAKTQCGATLGERMDHALREGLGLTVDDGRWTVANSTVHRPPSTVLIGSDSPDLPAKFVCEAFGQLAGGADVVLGPAADGGYYLIGVRAPQPRILREVAMSTPTVLADTLAIARKLDLRVHLLPTWYDVDTADDLRALADRLSATPPSVAPATRSFLATAVEVGMKK